MVAFNRRVDVQALSVYCPFLSNHDVEVKYLGSKLQVFLAQHDLSMRSVSGRILPRLECRRIGRQVFELASLADSNLGRSLATEL